MIGSPIYLASVVIAAVVVLLFLIIKWKMQPFIALLLVSMITALAAGMPPSTVMKCIEKGMGGTLGFIAVVVGLGAMFGQLLEVSGGAERLTVTLLQVFGKKRATWAMAIAGFLVAIPVFFDVGFIILVPLVYSLSRDTKRSLLYYGIPLLAGLAVTHAFVPPHSGTNCSGQPDRGGPRSRNPLRCSHRPALRSAGRTGFRSVDCKAYQCNRTGIHGERGY